MKFISIDTETTGLNKDKDQILEFGAVLVDTDTPRETWPTFHRIIEHDRYSGNAYAIQLNNRLFRILAGVDKTDIKICDSFEFINDFCKFLLNNGYEKNIDGSISWIAAGKNVAGFDLPFLNKLQFWEQYFKVAHRVIDPGSMYIDFFSDVKPPDLAECKKRAGINTPVTHNALEDAWDVVDVILAKIK